ncbi:pilus assembly protein [Candidatus Parcubacteria bacterium]|nr:MAG: pilus assembly protein [Candidatus Parcubacteria bacterium]
MKQKGQALVEMVIITPILIVFLLGVFEVGWALRNYLVLANANREAARFAVRQDYVDYEGPSPDYTPILTHTLESISGQVPFTGPMVISYIKVEATCTGTFTVTTPLEVPTYTAKFPATSTQVTKLDYMVLKQKLGLGEVKHVCDKQAANQTWYPSGIVTVEMWYDSPQFFGVPFISNRLTDPIPMYFHSTFRKVIETRNDFRQTIPNE